MPPEPTQREPVIQRDDSQFAYLQADGAGVETVRLAQLVQAHPSPLARDIATVLTIDNRQSGAIDTLTRLEASPDNQFLLAYVFQESLPASTDAFVDHNLMLFDMRTGQQREFVNEHRFSTLNRAVVPSVRLEEHIAQQIAAGHLVAEAAARMDYRVQVEGPMILVPALRWNRDGSFSVIFTLDVHAIYPGGGQERFAGTESFSRTYRPRNGTLEFAGWNQPPGLAALRHATFALAAGTRSNPRVVTFERQTVEFFAGNPAVLVKGGRLASGATAAIPRRYR